MHKNNNKPHHHHHHHYRVHQFVFAYGSLMDPESRAITNPNLANQDGLPVVVSDVERLWSARTTSGYTAMGVHFHKGAECTGVLLRVTEQELADLDKREKNYDRLEVHLDNVDQVPFLPYDEFYDNNKDADIIFDDSGPTEDQQEDDDKQQVKVWVYVQKDPIPADQSHPIPQSYVDIILRGCLTISEDFARSFIETTKGWHKEDVVGASVVTDEGDGDDENENDVNNFNKDSTTTTTTTTTAAAAPHFVNDREIPMYLRADPDVSDTHGETIDQLLEDHTPIAFENRVEYDPAEHLEALEEALEEDLAHPRAIKRAVQRLESIKANEEKDETTTIHALVDNPNDK